MAWVKDWDYCVFGKARGKKRSREGDEIINLDEFRRPQDKVCSSFSYNVKCLIFFSKILLLSGPPGLGKTTLAHVIARQAGYDIMEINAR